MNRRLPGVNNLNRKCATLLLAVALAFSGSAVVFAQKKTFSRRYPTGSAVSISLKNSYGTIEVQAWERDEVKLVADMDSPVARVVPELSGNNLDVNVVRDNRGKDDTGEVNFRIWVPVNAAVNIETRRGQITIRGVQGAMVRARVYTWGDIELTDIRAGKVLAKNTTGDIFFDGELLSGGAYEFESGRGTINIRIPANSEFRLTAAAPMSRSITLGSFSNAGLSFIGDGRKVVGNVGDGRASLTITNYQGSIFFIRR